MLAGRAEPRRGRARRAARDGRADRERRQEPLATATRDSVGYFQIRPSTNFVPAGLRRPAADQGLRRLVGRAPGRAGRVGAREDQADTPAARATPTSPTRPRSAPGRRTIERSAYPERYAHALRPGARARSSAALAGARSSRELQGVLDDRREASSASSEVGRPTPARASASTRSAPAPTTRPGARASSPGRSSESGHSMPAGNWAAVANWVGAAQAGTAGLEIVSRGRCARPGDLVAYDWGFGTDFGSDGHIGLLASDVDGRRLRGDRGQLPGRRHRTPSRSDRTMRTSSSSASPRVTLDFFELTVDYGAEELTRARAAARRPTTLPGSPRPTRRRCTPDTRRAVHAAAWRGLVARRALVLEPGPPRVVRGRRAAREPARAADRARARRSRWTAGSRTASPLDDTTCARTPRSSRRRSRACSTATRCSPRDGRRRPPAARRRDPEDRPPRAVSRSTPPARRSPGARDDTSPPLLYAATSRRPGRACKRRARLGGRGRARPVARTGPGSAGGPPRAAVTLDPDSADAGARCATELLSPR